MMAVDCGEFPHDSNLTIEIIVRLLHRFKVSTYTGKAYAYTYFECTCILQDLLPPVLYVQMDNTCRDNKNKYTITFAALLVQLGIFKKVWMYK